MEEDPEHGLEGCHELDWSETEAFALTAVVGTSEVAANHALAANDELKNPPAHTRRAHGHLAGAPESMVQRFAAGLRSISRRRLDHRR